MPTRTVVTTDVGTFSRRTSRTYTHIVVAGPTRAEHLEAVRLSRIAYARQQVASYDRALLDVDAERRRGGWGSWYTAEWVAEARQRCLDEIAKYEAQGVITEDAGSWGVLGWCGRLDLAQKLASSSQTAIYRGVRIYAIDSTRVQ